MKRVGKILTVLAVVVFALFSGCRQAKDVSEKPGVIAPGEEASLEMGDFSLFSGGTGTSQSGSTFNFGIVQQGDTSSMTFLLRNSSTRNPASQLRASQVATPFKYKGGTYPGQGGDCGTALAPGQSCKMVFEFAPMDPGLYSKDFSLSFESGKGVKEIRYFFSGTALPKPLGNLGFNGVSSVEFPVTVAGTSDSKTLTLKNTGDGPATQISFKSLSAPFSYGSDGNCGETLAAGASCSVVVAFRPMTPTISETQLSYSYRDGLKEVTPSLTVKGTGARPAAGELDKTFGDNGKRIVGFTTGTDVANALAIQSDGKIIMGGGDGNGDWALTRLDSSGNVDTGFGKVGLVQFDLGTSFDTLYALALDADGKILAGGTSDGAFTVVRFLSDGKLDTSFGNHGIFMLDLGGADSARAISVLSNGKIAVAGTIGQNLAVVKLLTTGNIDTSFGVNGITTADFGGNDAAFAMAVQTDGKIVAGGRGGKKYDFALMRVLESGVLDPAFGTGGTAKLNLGSSFDSISSVEIDKSSRIVATGTYYNGSFTKVVLARFTTSGSTDSTFGNDGVVKTSLSPGADYANAARVLNDGKILVGGYSYPDGDADFSILRLKTDGTADASFGGTGYKTYAVGESTDWAFAMAVQTDGRILLAGSSSVAGSGQNFSILRLWD